MSQLIEPSRRELWMSDLDFIIRGSIAKLRSSGITSMPTDNLWQCTRIVSIYAPLGVNAAWVVRQDFETLIASREEFRSFVKG